MAVKIRLTRTGARNAACFRVVVTDVRSPRDGRVLEQLGWYDPRRDGANFEIKQDRIEYWQGRGATLSNTVKTLLKRATKAAESAAV